MKESSYGNREDSTGCTRSDIVDIVQNYKKTYKKEDCEALADLLRDLADDLEDEDK